MSDPVSFQVLEIRAGGAYATVVRARRAGDPLEREVAVKALRATLVDNARALMRTRDEARLLARLSHPNIVRVEELLAIERRPVLVMEWVEGASLRELLDRYRAGLPLGAVLEVLTQTARGLEAAWNADGDQGQPLRIVHRDVKPGNLLLSSRGALKVVDFGLSRGEYFERETTTVSTVLGSMGYMAPERFRNGIGDDPAIDLYALGLSLVELSTGRLPLLPRDPALHDRSVAQIASEVRPIELGGAGRLQLQRLVVDLCRFDPEQRPGYPELRDRIAALQQAEGLDNDLTRFAERYVVPFLDERPKIDPRRHAKWEEVAFLEDPGEEELPKAVAHVDAVAMADLRVRRFLTYPDWAARKRELKWLLALHPEWTAGPFVEILHRTTRPWWVFWNQAVSTEEVAVALEILRHRPVEEARPYAEQLVGHSNARVSQAARVVLERIAAELGSAS